MLQLWALFGIFVAFMTWLGMQQERARRKRAIDRAQAKLDQEREEWLARQPPQSD